MSCPYILSSHIVYDGRFTVNEWRSNEGHSSIVIDYSVNPYKWAVHNTLWEWEWDPFNFNTGIIYSMFYRNIEVPVSGSTVTYDNSLIGRAPVCPTFIINTKENKGMTINFHNKTLDVSKKLSVSRNGTYQFPEIIFYGDEVKLDFKCNSTDSGFVSIDFRQGRL